MNPPKPQSKIDYQSGLPSKPVEDQEPETREKKKAQIGPQPEDIHDGDTHVKPV